MTPKPAANTREAPRGGAAGGGLRCTSASAERTRKSSSAKRQPAHQLPAGASGGGAAYGEAMGLRLPNIACRGQAVAHWQGGS